MIKPSVGRVVLVNLGKGHEGDQPIPGLVTSVLNDRKIHVAGFKANGQHFALTPVVLLQDDDAKPGDEPFAYWMDYQKAQASADVSKTPTSGSGASSPAKSDPVTQVTTTT